MPERSYQEIEESLKGLPSAWYPALLRLIVMESYKADVWLEGGASRFVAKVESSIPAPKS